MATLPIHPYLDPPGDGPDIDDREYAAWCQDHERDPGDYDSLDAYTEWLTECAIEDALDARAEARADDNYRDD